MDTEAPLLKRSTVLNPYRLAASLVMNRFLWDISLQSWRSRSALRRMQNLYFGEKAVILCNGPSLLNVDFGLLSASGAFTFGLNKINLLFNKVEFRPSCIVAVNPHVIEQNLEFYNKTNIQLFVDSKSYKTGIKPKKNVVYLHTSNMRGEFARDCSFSIFKGNTVTYVAMQLAFHLGFKKVAIVGCDHDFITKGPANKTVIAGNCDPNHFDKNYFSKGVQWQLPDLFESEVAYKIARDMFEYSGRSIVNATHGGKLEVFPRIGLEKFLSIEDDS